MSGGPILNNGTKSTIEKSNVWRLKKKEIHLVKAWINLFAETKTNKGKEVYKFILGKKILSQKREQKVNFTPCKYKHLFTMVELNFVKE